MVEKTPDNVLFEPPSTTPPTRILHRSNSLPLCVYFRALVAGTHLCPGHSCLDWSNVGSARVRHRTHLRKTTKLSGGCCLFISHCPPRSRLLPISGVGALPRITAGRVILAPSTSGISGGSRVLSCVGLLLGYVHAVIRPVLVPAGSLRSSETAARPDGSSRMGIRHRKGRKFAWLPCICIRLRPW